jgi:hypothetical protein
MGPDKGNERENRIMKHRSVILVLALLLLAGCSTGKVESKLYPGVPLYAPINPKNVEILRSAPSRPYQQMGEIHIQPHDNPSQKEIFKKFKKAAAKMGADAVILVADKSMLTGGPVADPKWWNGELNPGSDKNIVGIAIWYAKAAW